MDKPAPRIKVSLVVGLTFHDIGINARGVCQNISETGVLIRSSEMAARGAVAKLEFKEFNAEAEVIWTKQTDDGILLGMRFLSMGWGDRRALNRLFEFMDEHG